MRHIEFLARAALVIRRVSCGHRDVVVHFHSEPEGIVFKALFRRPSVLSYDFFRFRGGRRGIVGFLVRRCLLHFDRLLPCSEYCQRQSVEYWDLPEERVSVLYNGVNTGQFRPRQQARASELATIPATHSIALYVGRIARQKGSDVLIAAAERMGSHGVPVAVVAAGPMSQFDRDVDDEKWAERMRNAGVTYLGAVPEERLAAVYCSADIFVMPTVELEMFGMAALEALACGIPVVATNHGGLPEVVNASCGLLIPAGDALALSTAVERLVYDPKERSRLGAAAVERASKFVWDAVATTARAVYSTALEAGRRE